MASKQPANYARLQEEQETALQHTNDQIEQWEKYKSDYKALQQRLKTLPDRVSHEVMVPFSSVAFCPGRLVHTNEILVLLGDDWFTKRSARQAIDIVSRRMKTIDKNIHDLEEQKRLLLPRREFTEELQRLEKGEGGMLEIREEYDPEAEKIWKERHRASVQQQRQQEAAEQERNKDSGRVPLWVRLEELEKQEEEQGELQLEDSPPDPEQSPSSREANANSQSLPHTDFTPPPPSRPPKVLPPSSASSKSSKSSQPARKRVQWEDIKPAQDSVSRDDGGGDDDDDNSDDDYSTDEDSDEESTADKSADSRPRSLKITFSHSNAEEQDPEPDDNTGELQPREDAPEIRSPQDIYRLFCKPKSILKQSSVDSPVTVPVPMPPPDPDMPEKKVVSMRDSSAFTGTVVQRSAPSQTKPDQPPQPAEKVSKFRARRQQKSS